MNKRVSNNHKRYSSDHLATVAVFLSTTKSLTACVLAAVTVHVHLLSENVQKLSLKTSHFN